MNKIFDKVEIEAAFPGGDDKWHEYVEKNLMEIIPTMNKAPDGHLYNYSNIYC